MPYNGSGTFLRVRNWVNDAASNIRIRADRHDTEDDNFASGLTQCITKDGQTTITANLPMAGFKHTGVGLATQSSHYSRYDQVSEGKFNWKVATGTGDAIELNYDIPYTAYNDGMEICLRVLAANTITTPTIDVDGLGTRTLVKSDLSALEAGDLFAGKQLILRYDLANTRFVIVNALASDIPALIASDVSYDATGNTVITGTNVQDALDDVEPVLAGLGTSAVEDVGTAIGDVVQLEDVGGNAALPAVDGSQLTGLPAPIFSKQFISSPTSFTLGSGNSFAHGFGSIPKLVFAYFVCKTAEHGYSIGDTLNSHWHNDAGIRGVSISTDATNIDVRIGAAANIIPVKGTGGTATLNVANWDYVVSAWA